MLTGFGNHHQTQALPDALPRTQNSPQKNAYNLYTEQISGSAFTRARSVNYHTWLYRLLPSVAHTDYTPYDKSPLRPVMAPASPNPYRWSPAAPISSAIDWIDGRFLIACNTRLSAYIYQCNQSMNRYFSNRDGEMLFIPYAGDVLLCTEMGELLLTPGHIAVIPRGVHCKIILKDPYTAGYLCENRGQPLTLPNLGVIGANGLANPRHFIYPEAAFESASGEATLICQYQQALWQAAAAQSPLNVVAWQGNYAPYTYDLSLFNTINTVSFDHPDPSIFTVLTAPSEIADLASLDLVIFPSRWMVADHTFRPPYFHQNIMSEFMGLITGEYDAKAQGFLPGGVSIHNGMTPHGADVASFHRASQQPLKPIRYRNTLAFMWETNEPWEITQAAMDSATRQQHYTQCWDGFTPGKI